MSNVTPMKLVGQGAYFQMPMIFVLGLRMYLFPQWGPLDLTGRIGQILDYGGLILAMVIGFRIYYGLIWSELGKGTPKLITSDLFALTRHPMYHALFVMDFGLFFYGHLTDPLFWLTWVIYIFLTCAAGWYQEKETLARWGAEAEAYYAKTPRFIFEWLWRR